MPKSENITKSLVDFKRKPSKPEVQPESPRKSRPIGNKPRSVAVEPFFYIVCILVIEVIFLQLALPFISKWFPS